MRSKPILISAGLVALLTIGSVSAVFAQAPGSQNRIAQQVLIGGLRVDAAYAMTPGGGVQSYSCPGPQQYVTPDGTSQGWACFDPTTNVWLLSALPPQQAPVAPVVPVAPAPAPVIIQQAAPVVYQQPVYTAPVVYQYPVVQAPVIYRPAPRVVYAEPVYAPPVYVAPVISSSAIIGASVINAAGRIAAAAISTSGYRNYHTNVVVVQNRGHRR